MLLALTMAESGRHWAQLLRRIGRLAETPEVFWAYQETLTAPAAPVQPDYPFLTLSDLAHHWGLPRPVVADAIRLAIETGPRWCGWSPRWAPAAGVTGDDLGAGQLPLAVAARLLAFRVSADCVAAGTVGVTGAETDG